MTQIALTSTAITPVLISEIRTSKDNPRGTVKLDSSYNRLVESIREAGVLVPVVVQKLSAPEGDKKYELVDGERRYRASVALRKSEIPAHIIEAGVAEADLRKFMFHLHMTREQWEALAQVKSLSEMYPELDAGVSFGDKSSWTKRLAQETYMDQQTARDRVRLLAWPQRLRKEIFRFQEEEPEIDVYSYVLAIEASIVEPYVRTVKSQAASDTSEQRLERIRELLLNKLFSGLRNGRITTRDQVRAVSTLFGAHLSRDEWKISKGIFEQLISKSAFSFEDVTSEVQILIPSLLAERPAKPRRVIALMRSLTEILANYRPEFLDSAARQTKARAALRHEFLNALTLLTSTVAKLRKTL